MKKSLYPFSATRTLAALVFFFSVGCSVKVTKTETLHPSPSECKAHCCAKGEQEMYFQHSDGMPGCMCLDRKAFAKSFSTSLREYDADVKKYCGTTYGEPK